MSLSTRTTKRPAEWCMFTHLALKVENGFYFCVLRPSIHQNTSAKQKERRHSSTYNNATFWRISVHFSKLNDSNSKSDTLSFSMNLVSDQWSYCQLYWRRLFVYCDMITKCFLLPYDVFRCSTLRGHWGKKPLCHHVASLVCNQLCMDTQLLIISQWWRQSEIINPKQFGLEGGVSWRENIHSGKRTERFLFFSQEKTLGMF